MNSSHSSGLHQHRSILCHGTTLVEVIAALVLAATVLAGALTAYGRAVRQQRVATERLEAVHLADELLAEWFSPDGAMPVPESSSMPATGEIGDDDRWSWRLSELPSTLGTRPTEKNPFVVSSYRLEIITEANGQIPKRTLVTVEVAGAIETVSQASAGRMR